MFYIYLNFHFEGSLPRFLENGPLPDYTGRTKYFSSFGSAKKYLNNLGVTTQITRSSFEDPNALLDDGEIKSPTYKIRKKRTKAS